MLKLLIYEFCKVTEIFFRHILLLLIVILFSFPIQVLKVSLSIHAIEFQNF